MEHLDSYLAFVREIEILKSVLRSGTLASGRPESTAEHSWRLALLASVMLTEFPELDREKVLMMCLLHDLGEMYEGDIPAIMCPDADEKYVEEYRAVTKAFSLLPPELGKRYMAIWQEYETAESEEALFVKAMDKTETIIQHNQGVNPADFDYGFNLQYGAEYFKNNEFLKALRAKLDAGTRGRMEKSSSLVEVVIKPHHFFDIIKLYGAGITCFVQDETYQHDFYRIANQILAEHKLLIRLTIHGDDICIPCKHYSSQGEGVCIDGISHIAGIASKDEWNKILDNRIISMVMPDEEKVYTAEEFCLLLYENRDLTYDIWKEDDREKTKERFRLFSIGAEKYLGKEPDKSK